MDEAACEKIFARDHRGLVIADRKPHLRPVPGIQVVRRTGTAHKVPAGARRVTGIYVRCSAQA
jgi:hypothetical protein